MKRTTHRFTQSSIKWHLEMAGSTRNTNRQVNVLKSIVSSRRRMYANSIECTDKMLRSGSWYHSACQTAQRQSLCTSDNRYVCSLWFPRSRSFYYQSSFLNGDRPALFDRWWSLWSTRFPRMYAFPVYRGSIYQSPRSVAWPALRRSCIRRLHNAWQMQPKSLRAQRLIDFDYMRQTYFAIVWYTQRSILPTQPDINHIIKGMKSYTCIRILLRR